MSKNPHVIGGSVLSALALMSVAVMPASAADAGDTTATFTLAGGSLDVTVSDTRGSTAGWVMSAGSSTFVDGAGSISTGVSYNSGAATGSTGTVTPTSAGATSVTAVAPVAAGALASGKTRPPTPRP